ncbi:alginate O-acetyltransferase AlgX-related protein [Fibrella aquatica]|uniref:alginate O-acetyltransferase AlgX-related protein n=1 Tax=Fibrella aquatica TaxID=3242487 RepID=UPI003521D952
MKNLKNKSLVACFFLLICLPVIDQVLGISSFRTMEKKSSSLPEAGSLHSIQSLKKAVRKFDTYYKTNFGGRNGLVFLHSTLHYYVLNDSPVPQQVILGKKGWLYVGDQYNRVMQQHQGLWPLPLDSAKAIAQYIADVHQKLANKGIQLYILIAPDSHSIYPEYLPDHLSPCPQVQADGLCKEPETPHDVLSRAMQKQPAVPFLDIRDALRKAKQRIDVYKETDTHWSSYGAFIGTASLVNRIRQKFPTIRPIRWSEYDMQIMRGGSGDLAALMMLQGQVKDQTFCSIVIKPAVRAVATQQATDKQASHFQGKDPSQPSMIFFGDSFSEGMLAYIPSYFSRSTAVHQPTLDWKRIDRERPDIVVVEIVERNLRDLRKL